MDFARRSLSPLVLLAVALTWRIALGSWHNEKDIREYLAQAKDSTEPEIQAYCRKLEAALKDPRLADEGVVWVEDGEGDKTRHPGPQPGSPALKRGWALVFLTTPEGKDWLVAEEKGKLWLKSLDGQSWLKTPGGKSWKEVQDKAPSGLSLRVLGGDRLKLAWTDSGDRQSGVAIEFRTDDQKKWSTLDKVPPGRMEYLAKGLAPCTNYRFRLRGLGEANAYALSEACAATTRPRALHVLAIGISRYADKKFELKFADADARAFAAAWQKQQGQAFGQVQVKIITDEQATHEQIVKALAWLGERGTAADWSLLMFAGRGIADEQQNFFLCPYDFDAARPATRLGIAQVASALEKSGGALVFLDTPHSAAAAKSLAADKDRLVLAAEGRGFELESLGHGAFTQSFLDCLAEPTASDRDGDSLLSTGELEAGLDACLTRRTNGKRRLTMLGTLSCPPLQVREK